MTANDVTTLKASPPKSGDVLLVAGNGNLWTFLLEKPVTRVGRDSTADIVIDDRALSRQQFLIHLGPPIRVEDANSTNGTKVAGQVHRGGPPVEVAAGESFHVGPYSFMLLARTKSAASPTELELLDIEDPTVRAATPLLHDIARSPVNVLVTGESGVGKDILAHTLHELSGRSGLLQRINCAALPEQLLEGELFGHERGAFTGAANTRPGLFEVADHGTVFLDEIGELPLGLQAKLLRVVETREVIRLGASRPRDVDVRFVFATNRDLRDEVAEKRFRHDLYFRIDGITLTIPPLRQRRGMIVPLATSFAAGHGLSDEVLRALVEHDWPGNVRELKAVVERAVLLARGAGITPRHLTLDNRARGEAKDPDALSISQRDDRDRVIAALAECQNNQTRAAALLGISRTNLVTKMRVYRIPRPRS